VVVKAGVVGGSGFAGGELLRLLGGHPDLAVTVVAGRSTAGRDLGAVFPQLGLDGIVAPAEPDALAGCEVVFLATPADVSLTLVPPLAAAGSCVVDLSGAYRLPASALRDFYGLDRAPDDPPAVYGLPEVFRADLPGAPLVAAPGCYPTAALLALVPAAPLVDPASITVAGLSGTSGAGRALRDDLHASHAMGNVAAYGAPAHRHAPEIEVHLAAAAGWAAPVPVTFVPHLVPMPRGLVCTVTAALRDDVDAGSVREAYAERYADEPFVALVEQGAWPATAHVLGANTARVGVAVDERTRRLVASCAIDNLGKGAAGQAVQAANVALGLGEVTGLPTAAVYP